MATTELAAHAPTTTTASARRVSRLLAVAGAVTAVVAIWAVAVPLLGVDLKAPAGPGETTLQPVTFAAVVLTGVTVSAAGWALLAVLERFLRRARIIWTAVALAVLVVSFGGPLLGSGVPAASRITLALMHIAVAAILIPVLRRSSPAR